MRASCYAHLTLTDLIAVKVTSKDENMYIPFKNFIAICFFLLAGPNTLLSTPLSKTLSLRQENGNHCTNAYVFYITD